MDGVRVPESLVAMPPGPELAAVLTGLDSAAVANADTVCLLQAWARQLAHVQARFVDAVVQVGRSTPFSGSDGKRESVAESARRLMSAGQWAAGELAAGMRWTHRYAEQELGFAEALVGLPMVFAALDAGFLDRGRAWVFVDVLTTADLTDEQVTRICEVLVPPAPGWTTGQLRARLLRMVMEVDPGYAERRYRAAVRGRGVVGYLDRDGAGTVSGFGLPAEEAVAACERLDALAEEVRRAGHPGTLPQIRADLFTRLLDGRFQGLTREEMVAAMLAQAAAQADGPAAAEHAVTGESATAEPAATAESETADESMGAAEPAAAEPVAAAATAAGGSAAVAPASGSPTGDAPSAAAAVATPSAEPPSADPAVVDPAVVEPAAAGDPAADVAAADDLADGVGAEDETGNAPAGGASTTTAAGVAGREWSGGEIRVGLGTLLRRDERLGEVPGWGPVLAGVARVMVAERRGAQWRFAVTDAAGYLVFAGVTRRRPAGVHVGRSGVVELHVPATLLAELAVDAEAAGEWAGVVADIARQFADRERHQEVLERHPEDRFARAALRRHVQVRDRRCVAPGCRRAARRCELDHTVDHALGGDTVPENSGPLCLRHHVMKHQGGWRLEQPEPGLFRWTSPLGQVYWSRGEPICPPAGPVHPRPVEPDSWWEPTGKVDGPSMQRPPPPEPEPPPQPALPADDDEPPF